MLVMFPVERLASQLLSVCWLEQFRLLLGTTPAINLLSPLLLCLLCERVYVVTHRILAGGTVGRHVVCSNVVRRVFALLSKPFLPHFSYFFAHSDFASFAERLVGVEK